MLMRLYSILSIGLSAALFTAISGPAFSADRPQALGLVATLNPIPMTCAEKACEVVLSSFCLQQKRRSPSPADAYEATQSGMIKFTARTADGRMIMLSGIAAEIRPDPEYTSVRVIIEKPDLAAFGHAAIHVTVTPKATLVPVGGVPTDNAQDQALEAATGPHREIAAEFFETNGERAHAVDLANRLLNHLPRTGRLDPARRQSVWHATNGAEAKTNGSARQWVGEVYRNCAKAADASPRETLRRCLAAWHHRSLAKTNRAFWAALPGV